MTTDEVLSAVTAGITQTIGGQKTTVAADGLCFTRICLSDEEARRISARFIEAVQDGTVREGDFELA